LLHWNIGGLRTPQNFIYQIGSVGTCRRCPARRRSGLLLLRHCPESCAWSAVAPRAPTR
jgi:hypothetical protein